MNSVTHSLEILYQLAESFPQGILVSDMSGYITMINGQTLLFLNLEEMPSYYIDRHIEEIIDRTPFDKIISDNNLKGRTNFKAIEISFCNRFLNLTGKKISEGMLYFFQDVSDIINVRNLALKNIIKGQEVERSRLSKEIHDSVGPDLSSIRLGLDSLIIKSDDDEMKLKLRQLSSDISEVSNEVRMISHDLSPPSILDFGLISAIENFQKKLRTNSGLEFQNEIEISDSNPTISPSVALNIYRIIQEAVQNGIKHGQADLFRLKLWVDDDALYMSLFNNGSDKMSKKSKGLGIANIKSRAKSMLGEIQFIPIVDKGLEVILKIPKSSLNDKSSDS